MFFIILLFWLSSYSTCRIERKGGEGGEGRLRLQGERKGGWPMYTGERGNGGSKPKCTLKQQKTMFYLTFPWTFQPLNLRIKILFWHQFVQNFKKKKRCIHFFYILHGSWELSFWRRTCFSFWSWIFEQFTFALEWGRAFATEEGRATERGAGDRSFPA